jgi:predicted Rossmann fold flavoprotein
VSDKASDVLQALLNRLQRSGANLALDEPLMDLERHGDHFAVTTARRTVLGQRVILTTGGQSYPGSGTTGDGYRLAAKFGHTIVPPRPALTPLTTNVPWIAELRGVTLPDVAVLVLDQQTRLAQRRGSLLFAHFGLSGPVALDVSRVVSGHPQPKRLLFEVDLVSNQSEQQLDEWLRQESLASGKKQLAAVLATETPRRLAEILLQLARLPAERKAAALSKEDRRQLVRLLKHLQVPLTGTLGFKKAEVTAGGVALGEVDSRTMQSKLVPNLYFAGEILDLDGPIGGYNFQAAWSTGWLAGSAV